MDMVSVSVINASAVEGVPVSIVHATVSQQQFAVSVVTWIIGTCWTIVHKQ